MSSAKTASLTTSKMMSSVEVKIKPELRKKLADPRFTLNNLYRIVDKDGQDVPFRMNGEQEQLYDSIHKRNLVLKARQIGSTTFWCLYFLNKALFQSNQRLGIISYNLASAHDILNKIIKHAVKTLPEKVAKLPQCQIESDSAREISFKNGSSIRVDTTMRSGTLTGLLVTEFGKICARYPRKAEEIKTGSLNAVGKNALVVIESTAEGAAGHFYDMYKQSRHVTEENLNPLEWRLTFFPWWNHPEYFLEEQVIIPKYMLEYFHKLKSQHGITLSPEQKAWYVMKHKEIGEQIKQEYPSTAEEAFMGSTEGFWYIREVNQAKEEGRITTVPYQPQLFVETAWDIGYGDPCSIWVFQRMPSGAIHVIDYYENNGEGVAHYYSYLKSRKYWDMIECHHFPHDAEAHEFGTGTSPKEQAEDLGMKVNIIKRRKPSKSSLAIQVQQVRNLLARCYFDESNCAVGLHGLENYRKKWNESMSTYTSEAVHDFASHPADAFRYLTQAVEKEARRKTVGLEEERKKIAKARRMRI